MKLVLFLIFSILLFSCGDSDEARMQKFLLKGNLALKEQDQAQAIKYFEEALKIDPCFADALNNLGTVAHQEKHFAEAVSYYTKAIACRPKFLTPYFNRANSYYELKEYYSAQKDVKFLLSQKPDTSIVYFTQGLIAAKMFDFKFAIESFDHAIALDSINTDFRVNRGTVHYYLRQYDEALKDLAVAARINPDEPNIYNTRSMIEVAKGEIDAAFADVQKALQLSPNHPYFLNNRGYIYLQQKKLPEALKDIDQSIVLDSDNAWAFRNKGIYRLMTGDYVNAIRLFEQAIRMDKFVEKVHFYLGTAYARDGQQKMACDEFRKSERMGDKMVPAEWLKACR